MHSGKRLIEVWLMSDDRYENDRYVPQYAFYWQLFMNSGFAGRHKLTPLRPGY
jgi:hypothetical protein